MNYRIYYFLRKPSSDSGAPKKKTTDFANNGGITRMWLERKVMCKQKEEENGFSANAVLLVSRGVYFKKESEDRKVL